MRRKIDSPDSNFKPLPGVIFIDFDILNTEKAKIRKNGEDIEKLREFYTRPGQLRESNNEPEMFAKLSDDEVLTMHSWERDRIQQLDSLRSCLDYPHIVLMSETAYDREHFKIMCRLSGFYRTDLLTYDGMKNIPDRIRNYMTENTEYKDFAVVSRIDLRSDFPDRAVWIRTEKIDFDAIASRLYRYLGCDTMEYFSWYTDRMVREEDNIFPFYKVIFLDIDGVLNDEGEEYAKGVKIDMNMVRRLGRIVEETDADVVLSSSWKRGYNDFVENGFKTKNLDKAFSELHEALKSVGITIRGITPISQESGPRARSFEIREWLMKCHGIFSYVILEDDTFWSWGFLQRNVVNTITIDPSRDKYDRIVKGLTDAHVEKAVSILNERSTFPYREWNE